MQRCFELPNFGSQQAPIKRRRTHRAPSQNRVLRAPVEIRDAIAIDELQSRVLLKKPHHARAVGKKSAGAGFVELLA